MAPLASISDLPQSVANLNKLTRTLITVASICGLLVLLYYAARLMIRLIQGFNLYVLSRFCRKTNFVEKYGKWAVITGGSDGIGLGMAKELAKSGMSIIIISRSAEKLASAKSQLERVENVGEIQTIQADLADPSMENFEEIRTRIQPHTREIGVLINNAATLPYKMACFSEYEMESTTKLLNLNVLSAIQMIRMILPEMLKRKRGLILNVSSLSGSVPLPYYNLYGPSKVLLNAFTRQLQIEYQSQPIDFVLLEPGPVHTKLADPNGSRRANLLLFPEPDDYSKSAIRALAARPSLYSGTASHGLLREFMLLCTSLGLMPMIGKAMKRVQGDTDITTFTNLDPQRPLTTREATVQASHSN